MMPNPKIIELETGYRPEVAEDAEKDEMKALAEKSIRAADNGLGWVMDLYVLAKYVARGGAS